MRISIKGFVVYCNVILSLVIFDFRLKYFKKFYLSFKMYGEAGPIFANENNCCLS